MEGPVVDADVDGPGGMISSRGYVQAKYVVRAEVLVPVRAHLNKFNFYCSMLLNEDRIGRIDLLPRPAAVGARPW